MPVSAHWGSLSLSGRSSTELRRTSTRSSRPSSAPFHTCTGPLALCTRKHSFPDSTGPALAVSHL